MNNAEKNSYVMRQLTCAAIELLKEKELAYISIQQITARAKVSRNSFYRNYKDKEDIFFVYIQNLLREWKAEYEKRSNGSNAELYGDFFAHLKKHSGFYMLLKKRGLFHLLLKALLAEFGSKPEYDNPSAYAASFITYGTFGWIDEWIGRGMQESAQTMAALLSSYGMK